MTPPPVDGDDDRTPRRARRRVAGQRPAARRALQREDAEAPALPLQQSTLIGGQHAPASAPLIADRERTGEIGADRIEDQPAPGAHASRSHARAPVRRRPTRLAVLTAMVVVLVLLAASLGTWALVRRASVDRLVAARRAAVAQAGKGLPLVFSYDYRRLDADFAKAKGYLTGEFAKEYARTTASVVKGPASQYKVVVAASIAKNGNTPLVSVVRSSRNQVVLLVFLDQVTQSTRLSGDKIDRSRVRVTMKRSGGSWKIAGIDAL